LITRIRRKVASDLMARRAIPGGFAARGSEMMAAAGRVLPGTASDRGWQVSGRVSGRVALERDEEKWNPVFLNKHATTES
jgi:hypothetical protein